VEVLHCLWNAPAEKGLEEDEQVNSLYSRQGTAKVPAAHRLPGAAASNCK